MQPKGIGELAEMEFMLEASKRGLSVSKPFTHFSKYDFIVDNGKRLIRVQVKASSSIDHSRNYKPYSVICSHGLGSKKKYTKEHIDFFAVYLQPIKTWYFIPVDVVNALKIALNPKSKTSKYALFKENWNLLFN